MKALKKIFFLFFCCLITTSFVFAQESTGRKSKAVEGSVLGGVVGAVTGAAIGSKKSSSRALKGAAVGGAAGALLGGVVGAQVPNESTTPAVTPQVIGQTSTQVQQQASSFRDGVYQINVPKKNNVDFVLIEIKRLENGFLGPQGEIYTTFPTIEELQQRYGR